MRSVTVRSYAKLNLALAVTGKRADGYHLLDTVMRSVRLYDRVTVRRTEEPGIRIRTNDPKIPTDRRNSAYRAAEKYVQRTKMPGGLQITIRKRIPMEAGMGGSSADAAAVLNALCRLYEPLHPAVLTELAARIGADVPFQLSGGLARCRGIGDRLSPLSPPKKDAYLILKPAFGLKTPEIFAAYDRLENVRQPDVDKLCEAFSKGSFEEAAPHAVNVLELAAQDPEIAGLRRLLDDAGAVASAMTGSGSAVFGLFRSVRDAKLAKKRISVPEGVEVIVAEGLR